MEVGPSRIIIIGVENSRLAMPKNKKPECPACSSRDSEPHDGDCFYCRKCGGIFDDSPDDGGDYSDFNPAARLERAERKAERLKKRMARR